MLTFSRLEKKGNLGNQLFQIASVAGIAERNGHDFAFPKWTYSDFFKKGLPVIENAPDFQKFNEQQFHYEDIGLEKGNYDLEGWFQSEKYFGENVRKLFDFKEIFLESVRHKFQAALLNNPIVISIRRGDFVEHPDYFQLPILYYINALYRNFPDWQQRNIILLSDDIAYCKYHFDFLPNVFFTDQASAIEQLALSSLCRDFIISNSTFSWWCAWFGEKTDGVIIRPEHNFSEAKRSRDDDKDYFPERWTIFKDHGKIDLGHISFKFSKEDHFIRSYLQQHFIYTESNKAKIELNPYFMPSLSIKVAADLAKSGINSRWIAKTSISISPLSDGKLMKRQYDFGLFAKGKKNRVAKTDALVFTCHAQSENRQDFDLNYTEFYIQIGKLDIFALSHFYGRQKNKGLFALKSAVKKLIGYKKK